MLFNKIFEFLRDKSGNIGLIFALTLLPIMFSVGISVDYSNIHRIQSRLQETSDSAALYAVKGLRDGGYDEEDIDTLAYNMVAANYDLNTSEAEIDLDIYADTLSVNLETIYKPAFLPLLHINEMAISAYTKVIYDVGKVSLKCMIALNENAFNALNLVGDSTIDAKDCTVHVNSSSADAVDLNGSYSFIQAKEVCIKGGVDSGLARIVPVPISCPVISDPFDNIELPDVGACDHYDFKRNKTVTVGPGVYCGGMTFGGSANVTFIPGLYIIKDGIIQMTGDSVINGDGVTFFLTGDDIGINFGGGTNFHITAMSKGELAGFVFYFDPNSDVSPVASAFSGSSSTFFEGILYFGRHDLEINGEGGINTTSPFSALVANTIKLNGEATVSFQIDSGNTDLDIPDELYYRSITARLVE